MPDQYRVVDPDTGSVYANNTSVTIDDAVNRFARTASADFVDRGSTLLDEFTDYVLVDIELKPVGSSTWQRRFSGFVTAQDYDKSETSIDLLSHDHWLKRRKVDREFTNMDASAIVQDVVQDYTPLTVAPADINFDDEPTGITERFKGVTPAEIIATLTESSANEQFGATNDREFFLRAFDAGQANLDLTPGRYLSTDWEDSNRSQINQVKVKYGANGNNEVVVSDKAAQKALGDSIGSNSGVILETSKTFEGIPDTERETARAKAEAILERGEPIAIGEVETFNVGAIRPGQVVFVQDPDAGVEGDFRVADVQLNSTGTDTLLVAENREGVIDKLATLSEEQDRIEAREGALNPDTSTEFLNSAFDFEVNWEARILERFYLDSQLILGSERQDGTGAAAFTPRGGALGFEFIDAFETLETTTGTTTTVQSGTTETTGAVDVSGSVEVNGALEIGESTERPTDGGFIGDGFKSQTELVNTR